jgi:hypothetical protein
MESAKGRQREELLKAWGAGGAVPTQSKAWSVALKNTRLMRLQRLQYRVARNTDDLERCTWRSKFRSCMMGSLNYAGGEKYVVQKGKGKCKGA